MSKFLAFFGGLLVFFTFAHISAHPLNPSLLQIKEEPGGEATVMWKTPLYKKKGTVDRIPILPEDCEETTPRASFEAGPSLIQKWKIECGPQGLAGKEITVSGLAETKTDALVHVTTLEGHTVQKVLRPKDTIFVIPKKITTFTVFKDYLILGFDHILSGFDHLLFVFGLLLLVTSAMMLIKTVTAFTVGHSITLSLAVLGFVSFPSRPLEALIALTIFILALELSRGERAKNSLMHRYPWAVAMGFGLIHGLGFAGALAEVGLPRREIPMALFSFNVGIEIGQLVFVFAVLVAGFLFSWVWARRPTWINAAPMYLIGGMSSCWVIQRVIAMMNS